ncbi:MAG: alpha/beta hydrolase [Alphaproteobacteria bacterium]|nr:alpha/beta hydrolase [Alphaproteobacteria bacterium]|tara:strand:+ start:11377 stop:12354 length:978 start_codon:yes stop_codon:yes gene_type:complete
MNFPSSPRYFPAPTSISPEARAFLEQKVDPTLFLKRPSGREDWLRFREAANAVRETEAKTLVQTLPVRVEELNMSGVVVRRIIPHDQPAQKAGQIILEMHGGAYVLLDGLSGLTRALKFSAQSGYSVLSLDYRMPPDDPYPAAFNDALAVYKTLLETCSPEQIGLFGTSAGGNLAACLCLALEKKNLPQPAALVLNSPCTDMSASGDTFTTLETIDPGLYTYHGVIEEALKLYADGCSLSDPCLSPLNSQLPKIFPDTLLVTGTRDLLMSDTVRFHMKLRAANRISELLVFEGMWHAFSGTPEEEDLYHHMSRFFENRLATHLTD